jgi:hypothetical protein
MTLTRKLAPIAALLVFVAPAVAEEIEVLRGTESRTHRVGAGAQQAASENGVEVMFGIDPTSRSVDFETRRYELSSDERRSIRSRVQRMIELYRTELGIRVPPGFSVDLAIHGSGRSYDERAGAMRRAAGFYNHKSGKAVVAGRGESETHRTALHESSHAVLMHAVPRVPAWLNEGLAEYFEQLEVSAGVSRIPADGRRHRLLASAVGAAEVGPLRELFEMHPATLLGLPDRAMYLAYTQSWSVVTFLMEDQENRSRLREILDGTRRGRGASEAVERAMPGGIERLEADWRAWLAGGARSHRF